MTRARAKGGTNPAKLRVLVGRRRKLDTPAELVQYTAGIVQDVVAGALSADIGRVALYGVSIQMRLLEGSDIERRLAALEQSAPTTEPGRSPAWGSR